MVLQRLFCVYPPERGPFSQDSVVETTPKRICVRGKPIDGWIVTIRSDEDEVHLIFDSMKDEE